MKVEMELALPVQNVLRTNYILSRGAESDFFSFHHGARSILTEKCLRLWIFLCGVRRNFAKALLFIQILFDRKASDPPSSLWRNAQRLYICAFILIASLPYFDFHLAFQHTRGAEWH